jgi:hypothetical protein
MPGKWKSLHEVSHFCDGLRISFALGDGAGSEPACGRPGLKDSSEKFAMILALDSAWLAQVSLAIIACV